jgi:predicted RNA-binding protein with PUA-like domain
MAQFWLVKQEPEAYSWDDLVRDKSTDWTGVRNFQARNNLRAMQLGDPVLFYHSQTEKVVVGVAEVARAAYPDPTADSEQWLAVDLKPVRKLARPVTLADIRNHAKLAEIGLIKQSRLSVMPLTQEEFEAILALGAG